MTLFAASLMVINRNYPATTSGNDETAYQIQQSVALIKLTSSSFTRNDLDQLPRMWIHEMLRYAKAAGLESTYMGLSIIWSRFAAKLRKDISMPVPVPYIYIYIFMND